MTLKHADIFEILLDNGKRNLEATTKQRKHYYFMLSCGFVSR